MSYLLINGGKKLKGSIKVQTAKNSAVAILCASILVKGKVELNDVPQIEEVNRIIELLKSIGVKISGDGGRLIIDSSGLLDLQKIDKTAVAKTRSSLLLLGALAGRLKKYKLARSGGCKLGNRTVRPHIFALEKLGLKINSRPDCYEVDASGLTAGKIVMYESGDTPTENAIMAAVAAKGTTVIKMASANYMVADLCIFLQSVGAEISGVGTTTLTVVGGQSMATGVKYAIMPDPIVCMTLMATAIVTGSRLTIKNCPMEYLELELCKLEVMGQKFKIKNKRLSANNFFQLADIEIIPSKLTALPDKIEGRPFPGLNIDNLPLFVPILAKAQGRTLVHDWAYENRAVYSLELQRLGVNVTLLDPHRIWVEGPTKFKHNEVIAPPALRPAVNVFICMLAAKGQSILRNTYEIDRGYENLYAVLNSVGADVQVISK
ncbi:MAG: hypothetical protein A2538_03700 [Candidatus Magasanikbacteria bacterium RIFOXYD2_FULL_41_14]|uniref:UDP-N-acetylglucosamine 1-carboxyvinyltransferase n=1 Tax=Candidatus Magasanikbacteria bacterium RIFOXYD2_FULL_41_14 TaxID=1798709 RepID=A0A1F6PCQ1_9BACT|nr:MAG: hypothetical protein A2538_03700 [Candidatus Magasanikbacteria bacterium RIFOXYD2_FULL_41_14]